MSKDASHNPPNKGGANAPKTVTLGCRLNAYESDVIAQNAMLSGLTNAVIINTCAVTNEAVRASRQAVRRAKKDNPDAAIIVTGCAAQVDPLAFSQIDGVDRVIGNAEKMNPIIFDDIMARSEPIRVNDIMAVTQHAPQLLSGANQSAVKTQSRARAFVQVQNGCDHRCTFCIIPYGRGNSRSVPAGEVVTHVKSLAAQGYKEVVLTGVDISSWGEDLPASPPLGDLVARILKLVPDLPRLRLSSIDLAEIDAALLRVIKTEPRFVPYLHLSLQHGDSLILKRMKRRHSREDAIALCKSLRAARPDMAFGADIIAGFPTETRAQFENSLSIISEIGIAFAHIFPFSAKAGTPAAKMPQVDGPIIKARAKALREAADTARKAHFARRIGEGGLALVEKDGFARLPDFTPVTFTPCGAQNGELRALTLTGYDSQHMQGILT
ncbi:MAG: tRNA (N(6)-L-threonylcarbamoyladenosine(37)-C(2))-methylthiotransferase MtaB [Robiginitomaculum sp.]